MNVTVNYWAVLLAAISSMIVGTIWYDDHVFGKAWKKMAKLDENRMRKDAPMALAVAFISSLVMAYVLAHMAFLAHQFFGNSFLSDTLQTAFWVWLGFQAVRVVMRGAFEQRRKKLTLITISNDFVTIMVMALIIGWLGFR
jgi:hypothetical protein